MGRHTFLVLLGMSVSGTHSLAQPAPEAPGIVHESEETQHDNRLLDELRKKVEALPEADRRALGVEMLRSRLADFQTLPLRQRVRLSIGELYMQLKQPAEAEPFLKQAAEMAVDVQITAAARMRYADALVALGKEDEAVAVLRRGEPAPTDGPRRKLKTDSQRKPRGADLDFVTAMKEAETLQSAGRVSESLEILADLAHDYPDLLNSILAVAQRPTTTHAMRGDHQAELAGMDAIVEVIPAARNHPDFLSNLIMVAWGAKREDRAETLARELVLRFPTHRTTASHLALLAGQAIDRKDKVEAERLFTQIINSSSATKDEKTLAERNIAHLHGRPVSEGPVGNPPPVTTAGPLSARVWLVIVNVVVVGAFGGYFIIRRLRHDTRNPG